MTIEQKNQADIILNKIKSRRDELAKLTKAISGATTGRRIKIISLVYDGDGSDYDKRFELGETDIQKNLADRIHLELRMYKTELENHIAELEKEFESI